MLILLPLASSLNPPDEVASAIARVSQQLDRHGIAHRMAGQNELRADVLLHLTGGTEHLALQAAERLGDPVFLLAHPAQNSLPAALESLSRLRQLGRSGRIFLLSDTGGGAEALGRLAQHLDVRRALRRLRLGRIGRPSDWLVASTPEPAAVTAAWGPEVVDVPLDEVVDALDSVEPADAASVLRDIVDGARAVCEPTTGDLEMAARVTVAVERIVERHKLDACAVRCFDLVVNQRTTGCVALSWLLDHGITAGCEGDVPATLTMMWMRAFSGRAAFVANPQDLDPATDTIWLAHCTVPRSLTSGYELRSHFESSLGVGIEGTLEPGPATVARIGGAELRELFVSDGEIVGSGRDPLRCRTQVAVRLATSVTSLLEAPVGNHHVLAPGHLADTLREYHALFVA